MPRCQWCNNFTKDIHRLDNGRSVLLLCDLCAAQQEVLQQGDLRLDELVRPGLWSRIQRFFGRR